jgi:phosphoserine phosphatase
MAGKSKIKINLYDFDGTIYDGDSTVDFIKYTFIKYPKSLLHIPVIIWNAILYALRIQGKTKMKEKFYGILTYIDDIDEFLELFWDKHEKNIMQYYLDKKDHSKDVIISASPEFLLKPISKRLKVKYLIASRVDKQTGKTTGYNCHDIEKVKRLNDVFDDYVVLETYTDSIKSDTPILMLANKQYLVKHNKVTEIRL